MNSADFFWNLIRGGATRLEAWVVTRSGGTGKYIKACSAGEGLTRRRWASMDGSLVLDLIINRSGDIQAINCVRG